MTTTTAPIGTQYGPRAPQRWFYRCRDCLTVCAVRGSKLPELECSCGGRFETMGMVQRHRLVLTGLECPCDGRCTGAVGPSCDCQCGGENHGTGALVRVTYDAGPVPRIVAPDADQRIARAAEYRAALATADAAIEAKLGDTMRTMAAGGWISDRGLWERCYRARKARAHACGLKTHGGRLRALARLAAEV